jgi:hypothetical protein
VENEKVPDLETFGKICAWLGDDPSSYLGLAPTGTRNSETKALVHFKKEAAINSESAEALSELIQKVHLMLQEEVDVRV